MPPTRIGIIGLSPSAISSWASSAHLPYLASSPHYTITALCNSSVASAKAAIAHYKLPNTVAAYDSAAALAADPNVDLVVVAVKVGAHAKLVKPALAAGKAVFCEWPLGVSATEAKELASLAAAKGVRTYVGAQTRFSPPVAVLRKLLAAGTIGKVLSSDVGATFGPRIEVWMKSAATYLDLKSGGNPLSIRFAHFVDAFCQVLGEFESYHSVMAVDGKEVKVYDMTMAEMGEVARAQESRPYEIMTRTSPEEILLHGKLAGGAVAGLHFRTGEKEVDGSTIRWTVTGTEGIVTLTQSETINYMQDGSVKIQLKKKGGEVEKVEVDWNDDVAGMYGQAGAKSLTSNTGRLYNAIAEGRGSEVMSFDGAVIRQGLIDGMIAQAEA